MGCDYLEPCEETQRGHSPARAWAPGAAHETRSAGAAGRVAMLPSRVLPACRAGLHLPVPQPSPDTEKLWHGVLLIFCRINQNRVRALSCSRGGWYTCRAAASFLSKVGVLDSSVWSLPNWVSRLGSSVIGSQLISWFEVNVKGDTHFSNSGEFWRKWLFSSLFFLGQIWKEEAIRWCLFSLTRNAVFLLELINSVR